jgi:hypothetical protein
LGNVSHIWRIKWLFHNFISFLHCSIPYPHFKSAFDIYEVTSCHVWNI